jgi:hypothetical protein
MGRVNISRCECAGLPCVMGFAAMVVEDSVALLFSAAHFPAVECADLAQARHLADVMTETRLNEVMIDAAIRGSVGSVAVLMRVLLGRVFFSVLESLVSGARLERAGTGYAEPVTEKYKVSGADLAAQGYAGR